MISDNLTVESLRRFKDDATEVREGFECGIGVGYSDIRLEDVDRDLRDAGEAEGLTSPPGPRGRTEGTRAGHRCTWQR